MCSVAAQDSVFLKKFTKNLICTCPVKEKQSTNKQQKRKTNNTYLVLKMPTKNVILKMSTET